jgi:hypothetical protein
MVVPEARASSVTKKLPCAVSHALRVLGELDRLPHHLRAENISLTQGETSPWFRTWPDSLKQRIVAMQYLALSVIVTLCSSEFLAPNLLRF